jgi:hypothetical protein
MKVAWASSAAVRRRFGSVGSLRRFVFEVVKGERQCRTDQERLLIEYVTGLRH